MSIMQTLTPDDDFELLSACLGEHRIFGDWDTYWTPDELEVYVHLASAVNKDDGHQSKFNRYLRKCRAIRIVFWGENALYLRDTLDGFVPTAFKIDNQWNRLLRITFKDYFEIQNKTRRHLAAGAHLRN